jgi:uncharacterized SAM-binding protein YcdF (DUF218 family)
MKTPADVIIVLGGGIEHDGSLPEIARARTDRAVDLYTRGIAPRLLFSGRCGLKEPPVAPISEAAAMADRAMALGVPGENIHLEETSRDTIGNAYFTRTCFVEPNGWTRLRIVTSDFHVPRAAMVFERILGVTYDISFTVVPTHATPQARAALAREETAIMTVLQEWLNRIDGVDPAAIEKLIRDEHPGYAATPSVTLAMLDARVAAILRMVR